MTAASSCVSRLPSPVSRWLLLALLLWTLPAMAEVPVPPLTARVTDQTGTLAPAQTAALEQRLSAFEKEKGSQVAVLIVATTGEETIEQYALRVVEQWKLGRKGVDDGALLLVAKNDRRMRIEVGYGLEGALPDAIAKRVIAETITPHFRQGDFYSGIEAGVQQILGVIRGEPLPEPQPWSGEGDGDGANAIASLAIAALALGIILGRALGPLPGGLLGGVGFGIVVFAITSTLIAAFAAALAMLVVVLLISAARALPAGFWDHGGYHGRRHGGFGGGGFGGGGGFSGGGGSFGGGGASGSW